MALDEINYPPLSFFFEVKVGDYASESVDSFFSEVSGIEMEIETDTSLQEGGNNYEVYQLPGRAKYGDLTLKRGLVLKNSQLYSWCESVINNQGDVAIATKTVIVNLLSKPAVVRGSSIGQGQVLMSWNFTKAFPKKIVFSPLNANASGDGAIMMETIILAYRSFKVQ
jgi:phage tail-like protein